MLRNPIARSDEALLPPDQRPVRRVPRRPISFPLVESVLTFAAWYVAAVVVDRLVNGTTTVFTLAVIAPFAAFMLATITIAGRHMAFRLTAEDSEDYLSTFSPSFPTYFLYFYFSISFNVFCF